jgi:RNA-binding protein YhbY
MTILEIDSSTRSELRSQAHSLSPTVMIGADGLTSAVINEANNALHSHQLIKIRVLGDDREARLAIYDQICDRA